MSARRALRLAAALAAAGLLGGAVARAQPRPDASTAMRVCTRADLVGTWQVLRLGVVPGFAVDKADPAYLPHQRYVFDANANMFYLASSNAITPDEQRALAGTTPPATWAVDEEGRLLTQKPGEPRLDNSTCQLIVAPIRDPKSEIQPIPGDVLLTLYVDGKPVVRRLLRRVEKLPQ